ncbi:MAG: lactonase family protein [Bryobacteraceae bacterium]
MTTPFLATAGRVLSAPTEYKVYFGTYTRSGKSKGIYLSSFNSATGVLSAPELAGEMGNPSFLTIHPNRLRLYAVTEGPESTVNAFSIDPASGKLTAINQVMARGSSACYVVVDDAGTHALIANYGTGSVAAFPLNTDGRLGEASAFIKHEGSSVDKKRQAGSHAHSINLSADNRFAIAADLGTDQVVVYKYDTVKGTLTPNDPPFVKVKPGSGPRHFAFHPKGKFAYVINEMGSSVTAFSWDRKRGVLKELQTISTLPADFKGENNCAEVQVHQSGKFVYGSNRGHDSIAVYKVDQGKGTLTMVEQVSTQGKTPRNFRMDPTGGYMLAANMYSDSVVVFKVDQNTGKLTPTGQKIEVGSPVCMKFL